MLTKEQIIEIGRTYGKVNAVQLAKKFSVAPSTISCAVNRLRKGGINIPKPLNKVAMEYSEAIAILKSGVKK